MAYIYLITNKINNKKYVGKTNFSIEKRFREHCLESKKERSSDRPLYRAMNKYGIENFSISVIEECLSKESSEKEIYWIGRFDSYGKNGYNATIGGDSKILYNYKELSDMYEEYKSIKKVAEIAGCDVLTVRTACKENNIKIIDQRQLQKDINGKKVLLIDKSDENIKHVFSSISEAADFLIRTKKTKCKNSTIRMHISHVCRGKRKSVSGYFCKFI